MVVDVATLVGVVGDEDVFLLLFVQELDTSLLNCLGKLITIDCAGIIQIEVLEVLQKDRLFG